MIGEKFLASLIGIDPDWDRGEMSNRTENYAKAKILIMHAF